MAADLSANLAAVANLFSVQAFSWGVTSLMAGSLSDRIGRRPVLAAALLVLVASRVGLSAAQTYTAALLWNLLSGVGGGAFMGAVFAAVADHVPIGTRGRALGWVMTGQSLSLVLGVPLITLLGAFGGWRGATLTHGATLMAAAVALWVVVPASPPRHAAAPRVSMLPVRELRAARVGLLLAASAMERVCFASLTIYLATYLQQSYAVDFSRLALALLLVALGNLGGNLLGGQLADRQRNRTLTFGASLGCAALLAPPLLLWHPGLWVSVLLGCAYSLLNALGRPSLLTALSDVPAHVRGAVLGLNVTVSSIGWLLAAGVGGVLVARLGFGSLGAFCTLAGLAGSALAVAHRSKPQRAADHCR
jgi:predicted MFS family arabinose efflux permease